MRQYRLLKDRLEHKAGTIAYECNLCDYGLCGDDTRATGLPHIKLTLDPHGGYPFFTIPERDVEETKERGS